MIGRLRSGIEIRERILTTIEQLHAQRNSWPSQQAVRQELKLPRANLRYHVLILEDAGLVERLEGGRILRTRTAVPA